MSPRRNLPRRTGSRRIPGARAEAAPLDDERARRGVQSTEWWDGELMAVRMIPGGAATKPYRCPGCEQEIPAGWAHVVAWRAEARGGLDDRRHWHSGCWRARERRGPGAWRAGRRMR